MVNVDQTFPIQIEGRGFKALDTGDYKPGEFRTLKNMEILDGRLVGRRDIRSVLNYKDIEGHSIAEASFISHFPQSTNIPKCIGYLNDWSIFANRNYSWAVSSSGIVNMLRPTTFIPNGVGGTVFKQFEGFFKYNFVNYWLCMSLHETSGIHFRLGMRAETDNDYPGDYIDYNGMTYSSNLITIAPTDRAYRDFKHNNFFIFKERLWICNSDGIYFSQATDPTKFAVVDDGGFFKFPDTRVNYAVALNDTIYAICENSVYAITYSLGPNDDPTVRKISSVVGGDHGVVFRDSVYFINREGIFNINNNYVEKLIDNKFDTGENNYDRQTLHVWKEYLIIQNAYLISPFGLDPNSPNGSIYNLFQNPSFGSKTAGIPNQTDPLPNTTIQATGLNPYLEIVPSSFSQIDPIGWKPTVPFLVNENSPYTVGFRWNVYSSVGPYGPATPDKDRKVKIHIYYYSDVGGTTLISSESLDVWSGIPGVIYDSSQNSSYYRFRLHFDTPASTQAVRFEIEVSLGDSPESEWKSTLVDRFSECILHYSHEFVKYFDGNTGTEDAVYSWEGATHLSSSIRTSSAVAYNNWTMPVFGRYFYEKGNNTLGTSTIFVNMDNGSFHTVSLKSKRNLVWSKFVEFVTDEEAPFKEDWTDDISMVVVNPYVSSNEDSSLLLVAGLGRPGLPDWRDSSNYGLYPPSIYSEFFYMKSNHSDAPVDIIPSDYTFNPVSPTAGLFPYRPRYEMELDSLTPDEAEFLIKKFRNLEIMGKLPYERFMLQVAFDDNEYGPAMELRDALGVEGRRPHFPHRIGLNQRGASISLRFFMQEEDTEWGDPMERGETYDKLEISRMQLLFSPTLRSFTKRSNI